MHMEKIQAKDLTPEYVIEKLKDTHPLFKYGHLKFTQTVLHVRMI